MSGPGSTAASGPPPALVAAGVTTTILLSISAALRITTGGPGAAPLLDRLVPELVAGALVCAFGLLIVRSPRAAWLAAATGSGIVAVDIIAVTRSLAPTVGVGEPASLVAVGGLGALAASAVAIGYATAPRTPGDGRVPLILRAGASICGVVAVSVVVWAIASTPAEPVSASDLEDAAPVRIMARVLLAVGALGITVGLVRDVGGAGVRARGRIDTTHVHGDTRSLAGFLAAFADELLPLRVYERRRMAETERAQLAADLHALVLPDLRRAASAAERGDDPAAVATGLRRSLEGIERLMHERQSVVLDEFGLIAALEWLAERTEEQGGIVVALELEGEPAAEPDAIPAEVARVAFRVALLALDNVVRHAGARHATIHLTARAAGLHLSVIDDGHGRPPSAVASFGRGLRDMRRSADGVGASLTFRSGAEGTLLELLWPAASTAGQSAMPHVGTAAGPDAAAR